MGDRIDPGIYTNFFQVEVENFDKAGVFCADVNSAGSANELRPRLRAHVHQIGSTVFGYGAGSEDLTVLGFITPDSEVLKNPDLVARVMIDGFLDRLEELGYHTERSRIRHRVYHPERAIAVSLRQIRIVPGYMLRSSFFRDPLGEDLVYGLVIDPWYRLEMNGNPANFGEIRQFANVQATSAASGIISEVMVKIGMLTPYRKRNRESFKAKVERTLALLAEAGEFSVGGSSFRISPEPTRVILQE